MDSGSVFYLELPRISDFANERERKGVLELSSQKDGNSINQDIKVGGKIIFTDAINSGFDYLKNQRCFKEKWVKNN